MSNNLSLKTIPVKRKHYEIIIDREKEKYFHSNKRKKIIDDTEDPFQLNSKSQFSILSPLSILRNFPYNFIFSKYFEDDEYKLIQNNLDDKIDRDVMIY